jgi:alginate O-acetyltransferase complex protein AlgI
MAWPLTVYWICLTWIFFRAADLNHAGAIAKSFVFWQSAGTRDIGIRMIWIVILLGIVHRLNARGVFSNWWRRGSSEAFAAGYGCSVALVLVFIPAKYTPFIYFQF